MGPDMGADMGAEMNMGADMGANLEPAGDMEQIGGLDILGNDNSLDDINFEDIDVGNLDTTLTGGGGCSSHNHRREQEQDGGGGCSSHNHRREQEQDGGGGCSSHNHRREQEQDGGENEIVGYSGDISYAPFNFVIKITFFLIRFIRKPFII